MAQEPLTLYKLIVLYLLDRVSFPLTTAQISDFILEKDYTNYLTLQQVIHELLQAGLIRSRTLFNRTQLSITQEGQDSLSYFGNRISAAIKADVAQYLKENGWKMREEASVQGRYYKAAGGGYSAVLTAADKEETLVSIQLNVPTSALAAAICDNWQKRSQEIYQYLTAALF